MYYKIVNYEKGKLKTLFHGVEGSKILEPMKWLRSERKIVSDGSSNKKYISGWHLLESHEECIDYLKLFKNTENKLIIPCLARGAIWRKNHSRKKVWLASEIFIPELDL